MSDFKRCISLLLSREQYSNSDEGVAAKKELLRYLSTNCVNHKFEGMKRNSRSAVETRRILLEFFVGLLIENEDVEHAEILLNGRVSDTALLESPLLMQYVALVSCLRAIKYSFR